MMSSRPGSVRAALGGAVVAVALLAGVIAAPAAGAATPWWQIEIGAAPTHLPPGGEGQIDVQVTNLGDAPAEGAVEPIAISDVLPAGMTATAIYGGTITASSENLSCSLAALSCSFDETVAPYEPIAIVIKVAVGTSSGASDRVSVAGGGAAPVALSEPLTVSSTPAGFGVEAYEFNPTNEDGSLDTQAGSHPFQLTTALRLNEELVEGAARVPVGMSKDLHFNLPPGLVGNPTVVPQCTEAEFTTTSALDNECPANTAVGVAAATIRGVVHGRAERTGTFTVPLFNLVPAVGEPARFGFEILGVLVYLDTSVRTGGDYGVTVSVNNVSEILPFDGSQVTFWGVPGDPRHDNSRGWECVDLIPSTSCAVSPAQRSTTPLLTLPTACGGVFESVMSADSWEDPGQAEPARSVLRGGGGEPLGLDGCNRLSFQPTIGVVPDGQAASTPTGLSVGIHVPQEQSLNPTGLAEADVKDTTVTLPEGVQLSPAAADGLLSCPLGAIGLESAGAPTCPEASKVGTVEIATPLLTERLTGAAYLAAQGENPFGSLVALYVVAEDPAAGVRVKLAGKVTLDPVTGQLVSTFENTPPLPFSELKLNFFGSARAPLSTPPSCGSYMTRASIVPSSGNAPVEPTSTFLIDSGPGGSPCSSPRPFTPGFTAGSTNLQSGEYTPFTMTMSRPDADQTLSGITLRMPPGLAGSLSKVELCPEPQASLGTCGPGSLIGYTVVSAGLGGDPFTVEGGQIFITGPYEGAPFGLSILNPAKAGPFNLGNVVVRARIEVDPVDAHLTITTDPLPTIIQGIPLQLQHVSVVIDRSQFTFNPTNCEPLSIAATMTSSEGASYTSSSPFQVTNCGDLGFTPSFAVSTSSKTSRVDGASLDVKLSYPLGPKLANIAKVKVELPRQLPSRLTTLQKACPEATFAVNPESCPAASRVGEATATTPILAGPLTGPAYFVSHGGAKFPELIVVLRGEDGVTVDLHGETFISKKGITSSTFNTIPDVPVGSFELKLPAGPYSALTANVSLCKSRKLVMPTEFVAQNAAVIRTTTKIQVTGCPKSRTARHKGGHRGRRSARGKRG
jgi:hypothetical protein